MAESFLGSAHQVPWPPWSTDRKEHFCTHAPWGHAVVQAPCCSRALMLPCISPPGSCQVPTCQLPESGQLYKLLHHSQSCSQFCSQNHGPAAEDLLRMNISLLMNISLSLDPDYKVVISGVLVTVPFFVSTWSVLCVCVCVFIAIHNYLPDF